MSRIAYHSEPRLGSNRSRQAELLTRLLSVVCGVALLWAVIGCGSTASSIPAAPVAPISSSTSAPAQTASGVHGRAQAGPVQIVGAHIYLYAAATTGYSAASLPLLDATASGVAVDSLGPYIVTDAQGAFDFTDRYSCIPGQLVYALAQGGSAGYKAETSNPALAMMTVLGTCPADGNFSNSLHFLNINQVSTVVSVYALAGFMTDVTHVSASGTDNAKIGLRNAFANVLNLVDVTAGAAYTETPQSSGVVPQAEINTLANLLVPCIGSNAACPALFALTPDHAGHAPTDTITAMLNLARNPGANVPALFAQAAANTVFRPSLTAAPADWTIAVTYLAENMAGPYFPAIDGAGNLWVPGFANDTLTEFSPTGDLLSGNTGRSGGGLSQPFAVAIDPAGNAWVSSFGQSTSGAPVVSEFGANGSAITPSGFGCGARCTFLAIDSPGSVWVSGSPQVTTLKSSGSPLSTFNTNGFEAGIAIDSQGRGWTVGSGRNLSRLTLPGTVAQFAESVTAAAGNDLTPLAIDSADNVWFVSNKAGTLGKHSTAGLALSPVGGFSGGGLQGPAGIAIDGSDCVWVANRDGNSVSAFRNDGTPMSPTAGYSAAGIANPRGIAIDPSGSVWLTNFTGNSVTEFIGLATPTATPILPGNHGQRP